MSRVNVEGNDKTAFKKFDWIFEDFSEKIKLRLIIFDHITCLKLS